jgi:hypothetical protein
VLQEQSKLSFTNSALHSPRISHVKTVVRIFVKSRRKMQEGNNRVKSIIQLKCKCFKTQNTNSHSLPHTDFGNIHKCQQDQDQDSRVR